MEAQRRVCWIRAVEFAVECCGDLSGPCESVWCGGLGCERHPVPAPVARRDAAKRDAETRAGDGVVDGLPPPLTKRARVGDGSARFGGSALEDSFECSICAGIIAFCHCLPCGLDTPGVRFPRRRNKSRPTSDRKFHHERPRRVRRVSGAVARAEATVPRVPRGRGAGRSAELPGSLEVR